MTDSKRPRIRPIRRDRAQSVTDLRASVADDRRSRAIKYCIAMGIRTACVISLFFVQGWWVPVVLGAAIVLPYLAVVVANVSGSPLAEGPQRPGAIVHVPAGPTVKPVIIDDAADSTGPTEPPRNAA